jgi:hypothetical protein
MVGQCIFRYPLPNKAPGGVYEARVTTLVNSTSPIYNNVRLRLTGRLAAYYLDSLRRIHKREALESTILCFLLNKDFSSANHSLTDRDFGDAWADCFNSTSDGTAKNGWVFNCEHCILRYLHICRLDAASVDLDQHFSFFRLGDFSVAYDNLAFFGLEESGAVAHVCNTL